MKAYNKRNRPKHITKIRGYKYRAWCNDYQPIQRDMSCIQCCTSTRFEQGFKIVVVRYREPAYYVRRYK